MKMGKRKNEIENDAYSSSEDEKWMESYDEYSTDEEAENIPSDATTDEDENDSGVRSESSADEEVKSSVVAENETPLADGNPAWADAIGKILNCKPVKDNVNKRRSVVLLKAKKLSDVKVKVEEDAGFEIVKKEGGKTSDTVVKAEIERDVKPLVDRKFAKEFQEKGRIKPHILEKNKEKALSKIATKGVVQLFNIVRQQQKSVEKKLRKAGRSEKKKDRVLETIDKKGFFDAISDTGKIITKNAKENGESSWEVLQDNFMMGSDLKAWNKGIDIEGEEIGSEEDL